jgi:hypothetical protein
MTVTSQSGGRALDQARLRLAGRCVKHAKKAADAPKSATTPRARRTGDLSFVRRHSAAGPRRAPRAKHDGGGC